MHEASLHDHNAFVTLTYDEDRLPGRSLVHRDYQLFMKRLRERRERRSVGFFMCGEYGERYLRPHFHACLFGVDFPDRVHLRGKGDYEEFTSAELERLWGKGQALLGTFTFESAAYVARYCVTTVNGDGQTSLAKSDKYVIDEDGVVEKLVPEYRKMSRRPAIGKRWLERFGRSDVFPDGQIVSRGFKAKAPRYYDKRHEELDPEGFERVRASRMAFADKNFEEGSTDRLRAREAVARAGLALKRRS